MEYSSFIDLAGNIIERHTISQYAMTLPLGSIVYWYDGTTDMSAVIENDVSRVLIQAKAMMSNHPVFYDIDINE